MAVMKKLFGIFFFFTTLFAGFAIPQYVGADALCFNQSIPTPIPTSGTATLGLCTGSGNSLNVNITGGTIPTGAPPTTYPTSATGVLLVQPTNVPTLNANVTAATTLPVNC